jgi:hypothetical protein
MTRSVICEVCKHRFLSWAPIGPHVCSTCEDICDELEQRRWEAEAKAAGFSSFEAYAEFQQRAADV